MAGKLRPDMFGVDPKMPRIAELSLDAIAPNPDQPRKVFDPEELRGLAASIEGQGLLQPILVKEAGYGQYLLVAGERRFRAHQLLERATIFAIIISGDEDEVALIENMQRVDLRPIEEAEGLERLAKKRNYTHEQLANLLGKSRNRVTEMLSLVRLPEQIKAECRTSDLASKSTLIELARMEDSRRSEAWEEIKQGRTITVKQARAKKQGSEPEEGGVDSPFANATRALYAAARSLAKADGLPSLKEQQALRKARKELNTAFRRIEDVAAQETDATPEAPQ